MARTGGRGLIKQNRWESVVILTAAEQALEDALVAEVVAAMQATDTATIDDITAYLAGSR